MKIQRVKIKNYRNLKNIDVELSDVVALIGENNGGKSNFLKAITLPFLNTENGYYNKNLSWLDINDEAKNEYYKFLIDYQAEITKGEITFEEFINQLPTVVVEVQLKIDEYEEYYVKNLSYSIDNQELVYGLRYEYKPYKNRELYDQVKSILKNEHLNNESIKSTKMNLLPTDFYNYSITVPNKGTISYDSLQLFKYTSLEAERDEFSKSKEKLGSKSLVKILQMGLSNEDKLTIEKVYSHFFESLKSISKMEHILNWQDESELEDAKDFFEHINILPNMPPMQSLLSSIRLGFLDKELTSQGLGNRNLILLLVLINSLIDKDDDTAFNVLTIEEPEAHLCINNIKLLSSFFKAFTAKYRNVQLFYSTHSIEFINKMKLDNVVIIHEGKAFALKSELSEDARDYLTRNPNMDIFKLLYSQKCLLFEGVTEEMLIRSYIDSKKELNDIELISFHKGFKDIISIWKKINIGTSNRLGVLRDYDNQEKAKQEHDNLSDDKTVCIRTTKEYTLEPEIVKTGNNYEILKETYGEKFGWSEFTEEELQNAWRNAKALDMLVICKDIENGELSNLEMPNHVKEVLDFLSRANKG